MIIVMIGSSIIVSPGRRPRSSDAGTPRTAPPPASRGLVAFLTYCVCLFLCLLMFYVYRSMCVAALLLS